MVVVGIFAAAIVISIIFKWWVDGLVNGMEMIALSIIYGGLVFGLFAVTGTWPRIFVLFLLLCSAGWAAYQYKQDGIRQYYRDKIKLYERAIQADPKNLGARSSLAEAYYHLGDLDKSIAAMEIAVQVSPSAIKESHVLRNWQAERELRDSKTIVCQNCHSKNLWGSTLCRICRMPLVYPANGGTQAVPRELPVGRMIVGVLWLAISVAAFVSLPPGQAGMVIVCATLAVIGWSLLSSSKQ